MFMFKMELLCMFFDLGMKEACEIIFFSIYDGTARALREERACKFLA